VLKCPPWPTLHEHGLGRLSFRNHLPEKSWLQGGSSCISGGHCSANNVFSRCLVSFGTLLGRCNSGRIPMPSTINSYTRIRSAVCCVNRRKTFGQVQQRVFLWTWFNVILLIPFVQHDTPLSIYFITTGKGELDCVAAGGEATVTAASHAMRSVARQTTAGVGPLRP
jgi:hypothetical protein